MKKSKKTKVSIKALTEEMLRGLGENPSRQGLLKTPARVEASLKFLTSGYKMRPEKVLNQAVFNEAYDEMVVMKGIDIFSLCEHHLLPFYGKCHVAYIPNGKIVGLSKIPRIVDMFARRLQVQERLTQQIATCLKEALDPLGVAVVVEAMHLCMAMRGVEKQSSICVTSTMLGSFRKDRGTRMEFMNLISGGKSV